jgi:hypothetical protein
MHWGSGVLMSLTFILFPFVEWPCMELVSDFSTVGNPVGCAELLSARIRAPGWKEI